MQWNLHEEFANSLCKRGVRESQFWYLKAAPSGSFSDLVCVSALITRESQANRSMQQQAGAMNEYCCDDGTRTALRRASQVAWSGQGAVTCFLPIPAWPPVDLRLHIFCTMASPPVLPPWFKHANTLLPQQRVDAGTSVSQKIHIPGFSDNSSPTGKLWHSHSCTAFPPSYDLSSFERGVSWRC